MAYESFVGRRYLMAKQRSRVVSIITLIAVGGVGLGVTALIVVLSVMGGFTEDLTGKILGARAHVVIQNADQSSMREANSVADDAMQVEGVAGASPFIETEVMVSSPTNLSGVVLRGVDIDRVGDVNDLLDDIQEGKIEYLRDDRALMERVEQERGRELDELLDSLERDGGDRDFNPPAPTDDNTDPEGSDDELFAPPGGDVVPLPELDEEEQEEQQAVPLPDFEDRVDDGVSEEEAAEAGGMPPMFGDDSADESLPPLPQLDDGEAAMAPLFDGQTGPRSQVPGLIIGTELATSLQVQLGDEINVVTPKGEMGPTGPIPRSRPFRVVGIFYSGMYEYDANHAYTELSDAARLLDEDGAMGVELRAVDVDDAVDIAEQLRQTMSPQYEVLDWQEMNSSLFFALRLERISMFVVLTFIILVASFSIVAMLIMIVIEKAREIAILKSMGATNGGVMRIFMYQGLVIGICGALLGLGAGLSICYYLATVGIPLDSEVYYIATLPVDVNTAEVIAVVICAILISFLATLYPSYQAARLNPVKGLRYD